MNIRKETVNDPELMVNEAIIGATGDAIKRKPRAPRNPSKAQALRVLNALDRALDEAMALEEMTGNHFDGEALDEFICGLWHTEKAVLDAMGWKRDFATGEISRKKKEA